MEQSEYDSSSDIETPGESMDESDNLGNIHLSRDVDFLVSEVQYPPNFIESILKSFN